jgi:hypothetical protein
MAHKHGLDMESDVTAGPDEPIIYVVFGSAWLRPPMRRRLDRRRWPAANGSGTIEYTFPEVHQ